MFVIGCIGSQEFFSIHVGTVDDCLRHIVWPTAFDIYLVAYLLSLPFPVFTLVLHSSLGLFDTL